MAGDETERIPIADETLRLLVPGQRVFGRYTLEAIAGRGGMGVVWRARDEELERTVALKFLPASVAADPEAIRELKRETKRCLELTHPNIVRVHDFVQDGRSAAIAMEFIDGESLAKRKAAAPGGCLGSVELAPLVAQLCAALDYAHTKARIVHRDLKPANLLVTRSGELKVSDFGISRSLTETQTRLTGTASGTVSGTLPYMSPQQLAGDKPAESDDIYALGATLCELLAGKPPFYRGDPFALMTQIRERAPMSLARHRAEAECEGPAIPASWERTILACLEKKTEARPPSAGAVQGRLEGAIFDPDATQVIPVSPSPQRDLDATVVIPRQKSSVEFQSGFPGKALVDAHGPRPTPNRRPLWFGLAGTAGLAALAWWYLGLHLPAQRAIGAEREKAHQAELARRADEVQPARGPEIATAEAKRAELSQLSAEQQRRANARGGLIITTTPAGAEVAVRGVASQKSPATITNLKLGKYPIIIRLEGYEEERREAEVVENESATIDVALTRSTGTIQISSVPAGVETEVTERFSGSRGSESGFATVVKTPAKLEMVPTGNYELTFRRVGWPEQRQPVIVARNQTVPVRAEFGGGTLQIASEPVGAVVWLQGKRLGVTPLSIFDLVPGGFELEFHSPGYLTARVHGSVRANETTRVRGVLEEVRKAEVGKAWTIPDLGLKLVPIAPGTFIMGSESGDADEKPPTRVTLTQPYWLGKTEVTQREWSAIMGNNPSNFKGETLPVEQVSWAEAMDFCRKLTARERAADRIPAGYSYTLPSEAQWEYACRAGTTGDLAGNLTDLSWYEQNSQNTTHAAGTKQANAWGLSDMHGNVWEWCADWKGNYPGGSVSNYRGPLTGSDRVGRGGSWDDAAGGCRSAFRNGLDPGTRWGVLGFRLALCSTQ